MRFSLNDHSRGEIEEKKVTKLSKHCSETAHYMAFQEAHTQTNNRQCQCLHCVFRLMSFEYLLLDLHPFRFRC